MIWISVLKGESSGGMPWPIMWKHGCSSHPVDIISKKLLLSTAQKAEKYCVREYDLVPFKKKDRTTSNLNLTH